MKELKIINEQEVLGKNFKIYGSIDNPLFLAKDVAEWIDYSKDSKGNFNVSRMILSVDDDEKMKIFTNLTNNKVGSNTWFLTEDGLYEVLMQSRKPIAKQFKKEVKRILKTIRQTGGYVSEDREAEFIDKYFPSFNEETKLVMIKDLINQNKEIKKKIEDDKKFVDFAKQIENTNKSIKIEDFAKVISKQGFVIGRNNLYQWLRDNKYLQPNNRPYQQYINSGYFEVLERPVHTSKFHDIVFTTLVTGKGQIYFVNKLLGKKIKDDTLKNIVIGKGLSSEASTYGLRLER